MRKRNGLIEHMSANLVPRQPVVEASRGIERILNRKARNTVSPTVAAELGGISAKLKSLVGLHERMEKLKLLAA